jgi:hypothetical protein
VTGAKVVRVFFPCTGLGRQRRGFETFTRGCAAALCDDPRLEITVFGGGGPFVAANERAVPNLPRDGAAARGLGGFRNRDACFVECVSVLSSFL